MNAKIWVAGLMSVLCGVLLKRYIEITDKPGVMLKVMDLWEDKITHASLVLVFFIIVFLVIAAVISLVFGELKEMERVVLPQLLDSHGKHEGQVHRHGNIRRKPAANA